MVSIEMLHSILESSTGQYCPNILGFPLLLQKNLGGLQYIPKGDVNEGDENEDYDEDDDDDDHNRRSYRQSPSTTNQNIWV